MKNWFSRQSLTEFLNAGNEIEGSFARAKDVDTKSASWSTLAQKSLHLSTTEAYFKWLRRRSNHPWVIRKAGQLERLLRAPSSMFLTNPDSEAYSRDDFLIKRRAVDREAVKALSSFLGSQEAYFDIYQPDYVRAELRSQTGPSTVYVRTLDLVRSKPFWEIITSPVLVETCQNILGNRAKLTWAWLWFSDPREEVYENQNWHRDSAEPFNIVRLFVPLTQVKDLADGPTVLVKGSSGRHELAARRRFSDEEVTAAFGTQSTINAYADIGDAYFANTFCVHRGHPPQRPREMLSLLVSYQNSYRTKGLPRVPISSLTAQQAEVVRKHRHYFSEVCDIPR